jgi:prepilin peptidase CpaA
MDPSVAHAGLVALTLMIGVAAIAAITDRRDGTIPNWLTLPAIAAGLALHTLAFGVPGLRAAMFGLLACGLVPYLLFRMEAMGGGDVKLLAAIGALGGLTLGLEAQLLALVVAGSWATARLVWRGGLGRMLSNAMRLAANPLLPRRYRRPIEREAMTPMRLGGFIWAGTTLAVLGQYVEVWR